MSVTGLYDVEYRIVVACRDGNVYTIKNGEVTGNVIQLEAQPSGLLRTGKSIIVGCANVFHSYHIKGKKNFSVHLPAAINDMCNMELRRTRMISAMVVALDNAEVRVYNGKVTLAQ